MTTLGVTAGARELACRLSVLFESDVELVGRVNDAARRLRCANDQLWAGFHADAAGVVGEGGERPNVETVLVEARRQSHWTIHRAFCDYQSACEQRRQLAVDVGELSRQLICELASAGWSEQAARSVNVHELAGVAAERGAGRRR